MNSIDINQLNSKSKRATILQAKQFKVLIVFIALYVVLSALAPDSFFTMDNVVNIMNQTSAELILAIGMTFVLILGGIDLSVGGIANICGTLLAGFMVRVGFSVPVAILLSLGIGLLIGFINGFIIARFKIAPFITTLAMMNITQGAGLLYSGGVPISQLPDIFKMIGRGYIGGIPITVFIMVIVLAIFWVILAITKFGRRVYATGGNENAAHLSGINVQKIKITVYALSGLLAAVAGMVYTARLGSSQPTMGSGKELDAIAATVLGGTAFTGGEGTMSGTIIGAFFLVVLGNGMNVLGISSFWQQVVMGIVLIVSVVVYQSNRRKIDN